MSLGTNEAKEAVATLRDRLKHGQNMTKILESQLDTAQQNISLLQGQVRLANETILNLKKYFTETENTLNDLFTSNHTSSSSRAFQYSDGTQKEQSATDKNQHIASKVARNSTRSPRTPEPIDTKVHHEEKQQREREHHNKSPYAQQLRQVLDVLQDEEPKKSFHNHHHRSHEKSKDNSPSPPPPSTSDRRFMHSTKHYHDNEGGAFQRRPVNPDEDYSKIKHHKMNGHSVRESTNGSHDPISPKPSYYHQQHHSGHDSGHHNPHSNHCMEPCCPSDTPPSSYKMMEKSYHYGAEEKPTHYVEKSPNGGVHYIAVHSPDSIGSSSKHGERHHSHHYVPYAYHMPGENPHKVIHEIAAQPLSPPVSSGGGRRRKRAYAPLLPNEEPPHLKYTKVKRIDGSKLTAQKVLQDFTKRRFIPYNPRYDLDLLIVPPPIPASDLLKGGYQFKGSDQKMTNIQSPVPSPPDTETQSERRSTIYGKSQKEESPDKDEDVFTEPKSPLNHDDANNNNNHHDDNNNNKTMNNNNNNTWPQKPHLYSGKGVSVLPSIKEEPRSHKLEDQINRIRGDQESSLPVVYRQQDSPYNDSNNNENGSLVIGENAASPIPLVHRRTEQYCS